MPSDKGGISRRAFLEMATAGVAGAAVCFSLDEANAATTTSPGVMTVTGEMSSESLGTILPHEHVMADFVGADKVSRDRYDADEVFRTVLPYLKQVRALGCETLVECTPAYIGRDPVLLKRLSKASKVNIITNTGFYGAVGDKFLPPFVFSESAEELANRWIAEWVNGIEGSGIRPGFIKIGVDPKPSEVDLKLLRAAAVAHLQTGLTIASHTGPGAAAKAQIELLKQAGVHPSGFIWGHAQAENDPSMHIWAARQGAWVEFDGISADEIDHHVELVERMDKAGLLDYVLLSHDAGWYHVGELHGGRFQPFDVLFTHFLPALRQRGLGGDKIRRLTQFNPQQAFQRRVRKCRAG